MQVQTSGPHDCRYVGRNAIDPGPPGWPLSWISGCVCALFVPAWGRSPWSGPLERRPAILAAPDNDLKGPDAVSLDVPGIRARERRHIRRSRLPRRVFGERRKGIARSFLCAATGAMRTPRHRRFKPVNAEAAERHSPASGQPTGASAGSGRLEGAGVMQRRSCSRNRSRRRGGRRVRGRAAWSGWREREGR